MTNTNTLSTTEPLQLEDIIPPEAVNLWPLAPGWWLLLVTFVTFIIAGFFAYRYYKKHCSYRKEALRLLQATYNEWQVKKYSDALFYQKLFGILKRTALTAYPKKNIASLHGSEWVSTLKNQAPDINVDTNVIEAICSSQYQKTTETDARKVRQFCRSWVKQHKNQWQGDEA